MKGFAVIVAATLTIPGVGYSQDTPDGSDEKTPSVQVGDTTAEMTGGVAAGGDDAPSASGANTAKDRDGGLSDATTFTLADGLSWTMGGKEGRTRTEGEMWQWKVARGGAGRMPPQGFPRDNKSG